MGREGAATACRQGQGKIHYGGVAWGALCGEHTGTCRFAWARVALGLGFSCAKIRGVLPEEDVPTDYAEHARRSGAGRRRSGGKGAIWL
jgi:hypothetical protein